MWQYTTETIINSNAGHIGDNSDKRFAVIDATSGKEVAGATAANADFFLIDGVNTFRKCDIQKIYRAAYRPEVMAAAHIDLTTAGYVKGDVLRLKVVLHQQGQVSSIFQNAYLKHNKPFFFEVVANDDAAQTTGAVVDAAALVKVINRELRATDFHFFKATDNAGVINFEGADCYIRFTEIQLAKVEADNAATGAALLGYENYTKLADGVIDAVGSEGTGTVRQLVKNLRVPTCANVDPFGVDFGGKPVPGGKYNQYLIELESDRRHVGGQVMGALDRSITSHVFFINQDIVSTWETELGKLGTIEEYTVLSNPNDPSSDPVALTAAKTKIGSVQ